MATSTNSICWVENLADQECRILSGEKSSLDIKQTMEEVLAVETSSFIRDLFQQFDYLVKLFNRRVQGQGLEVRLLRENELLEGFSLHRNSFKLFLTKGKPGFIQIVCDSRNTILFSGLIEAKYGPFHDLKWHFLGSAITSEQLARHHLTEFIQSSNTTSQFL